MTQHRNNVGEHGLRPDLDRRPRVRALVCAVVATLAVVGIAGVDRSVRPAGAAEFPPGFSVQQAFSGLSLPVDFRFAPTGHVFVAEKDGIIKVFTGLDDTTPTVFADLRTNVYSFVDRGLLGIEVDPQFPVRPYVYALYSYDHELGSPAPPPRWNDACPGSGDPVLNGSCRASARLSRLTAQAGNLEVMVPGSERVLVEDWCQQFAVHINGTVRFGSDGALYAGHGDAGASHFNDYGQTGNPLNPCGDPPVPVGGQQTPPTAEGGSLRAQDPRTPGDPYTLDSTIIRVNPDTGAGLPGNPLFNSADANARRIVAHGLRMPFRFTARPGANELWIGDVGEGLREEIDRIPIGGPLVNAGWPCYEGSVTSVPFGGFNLCSSLISQGPNAVLAPYIEYAHREPVFPLDHCPSAAASVSGLAFYPGGSYPDRYDGALFFADFARHCIYAALPGTDGLPNPNSIELLVSSVNGITDIETGPGGDLYYNEIGPGRIWRLSYNAGNRPPTAVIDADRTNGPLPLTVRFDARSSVDPDGGALRYEWDLDGDGQFDDSTSATPQRTYTSAASVDVRLRAIDPQGAAGLATQRITAGNTAPTANLVAPLSTLRWSVGDDINFSATGTDPEDGALPASAFSWRLTLQHCPGGCHEHPSGSWDGIRSGSFSAAGHEFPSYYDLRVTVRDSGGLTTSQLVSIYPNVSTVSFTSDPPGLALDAEGTDATPFQRNVIRGGLLSVTAPHQTLGFLPFEFDRWSDGGAQSHDVVVNTNLNLNASYSVRTLRVPDRVIFERDTPGAPKVPVLLDRVSSRPVSVGWAIQPMTADAADITLASGRITIPAGASGRSIPISLLVDALDEPTETFRVVLDAPTNALVVDATADVQIVDNDGPAHYPYVASFDADIVASMDRAAAQLGVTRAELPRLGADLLRFLAALDPGNVPTLTAPGTGPHEYATIYSSIAARDAMLTDAQRYGLSGAHFHTAGAQILTFIALLGG